MQTQTTCPDCGTRLKPLWSSWFCPQCEGGGGAPTATEGKYVVGMKLVAKAGAIWWPEGAEATIRHHHIDAALNQCWEIEFSPGDRFNIEDRVMSKYFERKDR